MAAVLATLLAVVVALAVVLTVESRLVRRTESPVRRHDGPAPDSAT
jgi:hypothetical protein